MSLRNRSEAAKNIKPRENKSNFFQREKNKISEVIPSLLLVTDDIISPINVVFDATNKLFSGETFNEKNSLDKNFLEVDKVCNSLPTKTFNCSEMSNVESFCDPSEEERQEENYPEQISDELKFDKVLIRSTAGNVFDRRRKSDCPARHKAGVKLSQSLGPASQRVKSKSIERAVDIELSSHHLATSAANQKLNNIGNLILNLSDREFNSEAADENRKVPSPENKAKKHLKSNSLNLNKMPESGNFSSDTESKRRDSHDFLINSIALDNPLPTKRKEYLGKRLPRESLGKGSKHRKITEGCEGLRVPSYDSRMLRRKSDIAQSSCVRLERRERRQSEVCLTHHSQDLLSVPALVLQPEPSDQLSNSLRRLAIGSLNSSSGDITTGHTELGALLSARNSGGDECQLQLNLLNCPNNSTLQCGCGHINCPCCNLLMNLEMTDPSLLQ